MTNKSLPGFSFPVDLASIKVARSFWTDNESQLVLNSSCAWKYNQHMQCDACFTYVTQHFKNIEG